MIEMVCEKLGITPEELVIKQLQQENQQLKEKYNIRSKAYNNILLENASLHNKIDKAIGYINEAELGEFEDGKIYYLKEDGVGKELLKLLKDSDVNE